jgi:hypothetical protein
MMEQGGREPITGIFEPDSRKALLDTPPHVGFDKALKNALDQVDEQWRTKDEESFEVKIELEARLDFWNPGGVGQYRAKVSEQGGS